MTATLPIQTTGEHLDKLLQFLVTKAGWVSASDVGSNLGAVGEARKLNALDYLKIIDRDGQNVKLSTAGRDMARADGEQREKLFRGLIQQVPLYRETLNWIFFRELENPTKADIANYWIDDQSTLKDSPDRLISDGVICFFRMAEYAGFGKFVTAGGTREARLEIETAILRSFVQSEVEESEDQRDTMPPEEGMKEPEERQRGRDEVPERRATVEPGVRVNVEIHIAADATPETVEEIFKNMRKYVLNPPEPEPESG
jgi:hypothetical protein